MQAENRAPPLAVLAPKGRGFFACQGDTSRWLVSPLDPSSHPLKPAVQSAQKYLPSRWLMRVFYAGSRLSPQLFSLPATTNLYCFTICYHVLFRICVCPDHAAIFSLESVPIFPALMLRCRKVSQENFVKLTAAPLFRIITHIQCRLKSLSLNAIIFLH